MVYYALLAISLSLPMVEGVSGTVLVDDDLTKQEIGYSDHESHHDDSGHTVDGDYCHYYNPRDK